MSAARRAYLLFSVLAAGGGSLTKVKRLVRSPEFPQKTYLQRLNDMLLYALPGDVAQLGERDNRTVEVRGSSPLISTYAISA